MGVYVCTWNFFYQFSELPIDIGIIKIKIRHYILRMLKIWLHLILELLINWWDLHFYLCICSDSLRFGNSQRLSRWYLSRYVHSAQRSVRTCAAKDTGRAPRLCKRWFDCFITKLILAISVSFSKSAQVLWR